MGYLAMFTAFLGQVLASELNRGGADANTIQVAHTVYAAAWLVFSGLLFLTAAVLRHMEAQVVSRKVEREDRFVAGKV